MSRVAVIGGGPAGIMAAAAAAGCGHDSVLLEKNEKLGKKLFLTGKGRCNITNSCDTDDFLPIYRGIPSSCTVRCTAFPILT